MEKKDIVVVTGSSSCLGQQIVKLLQEKDDNTEEIRLFDIIPYKNNLGHEETKPMREIIGDIRNLQSLFDAFDGANCVIHTAAIIDVSMFPNTEAMTTVNVKGTANVIKACILKNVPRLLFASSTGVVEGRNDVLDGDESTVVIPESFMSGHYGKTKYEAEQLILKANRKLLSDGITELRTLIIRLTPIYGEEDTILCNYLKMVNTFGGFYIRVGSTSSQMQFSYSGNIAWCFIRAKDCLSINDNISGEVFFATDDTEKINIHEHLEPFLEINDFKISERVIPYWLARILISSTKLVLRVINPFRKISTNLPSVNTLNYMSTTFSYNRAKAEKLLNYHPIYTPEEAKLQTLQYFVKVDV